MTTQLTPRIDGSTNQLGLPPPNAFDLTDGDRVVGWVNGNRVGFRGFADAQEAAHAAWVAYRSLTRQLARRFGGKSVPIDTELLTIHQRDGEEVVVASGRDIATIVRFPAESPEGTPSFGFEVEVPQTADDLLVRSKAYLMYRTLRRSGVRWEMWQKPRVAPQLRIVRPEQDIGETPSALEFTSKVILGGIALVLAIVMLLTEPQWVAIGTAALVLIGVFIARLTGALGLGSAAPRGSSLRRERNSALRTLTGRTT